MSDALIGSAVLRQSGQSYQMWPMLTPISFRHVNLLIHVLWTYRQFHHRPGFPFDVTSEVHRRA